jgi:YARHG domain
MRKRIIVSLLGGLALAAPAPIANAAYIDQSCEELYVLRNEIYKARGFCFTTARAIATFGNAGCQYDDINEVPLSAVERRRVADIQRAERLNRCPR